MSQVAAPIYREFKFGITRGELTQGEGGVQYLRSIPLGDYAKRITDRFIEHAQLHPEKTFMAQRIKQPDGMLGAWRHLTWGDALQGARHIAQGLINQRLSAERPVIILSENDLEHAQLILGCIYAGVPYSSVSPAYSLISQDFEKLRHVVNTLTPGLVFAASKARYAKAIDAVIAKDVRVIYTDDGYEQLLATPITTAVDAAMQATNGDTIVKFLFTSGSTKLPKAVINTQRMWCANQEQMRTSMPALAQGWHTLVDWLPWNHTFAGNHNFGLIMYNGGTIYIDEGKPTPALIGETLRNLREISPTIYLNVPTGFEYIAQAMKVDDDNGRLLRKTLLDRVHMFFYAGAALAQPIWDSLFESQEREIGKRIVMTTGLGMTESSPFALFVTSVNVKAGYLGLPTAGMTLKLVPMNGKVEVRYKGDNVTPGYWRHPQATQEAFDEEGYFCTGDAVKWIDERDIHQGLRFDGRIAEDFKLATGTFVSVGPLRSKIIAAGAPYVQDAVITGLNLNEVGAMIFPLPAAKTLAPEALQEHFQNMMNELAKTATGSASRVARMLVLMEPPSIDRGEVTDKGSINQRAVLTHRAALVEALHADTVQGIIKPRH